MAFGLGKGVEYATIVGHRDNQHLPKKYATTIALFVIGIIVVAILICVLKKRQEENERTVTFKRTHEGQIEPKKRYRNGVEIKPSEFSQPKETAINETVEDLSDEKLLEDD